LINFSAMLNGLRITTPSDVLATKFMMEA
jgi:hypothetical protein